MSTPKAGAPHHKTEQVAMALDSSITQLFHLPTSPLRAESRLPQELPECSGQPEALVAGQCPGFEAVTSVSPRALQHSKIHPTVDGKHLVFQLHLY